MRQCWGLRKRKKMHKIKHEEVHKSMHKTVSDRLRQTKRRFELQLAVGMLTVACGIAGQSVCVRATGSDYYGQLDSFTGERIVGDDGNLGMQTASNSIWLSDTMYYDLEKRMFAYPAGTSTIYASVADGMIVRDRVTISQPDGLPVSVYLNGEEIEYGGGELSERGSYAVQAMDGEQMKQLFTFTIVGARTGQILNYSMPEGFRITAATRNGDTINWSRKFVDMSQEGDYRVDYECPLTQISYSLNVTIDTTPPALVMVGVDEEGKARGPVTITGKEEYDTISITRDGEPFKLIMTHTLTQSGRYVVTAVDEAGNISTYPFTIMIYLDRNGWIFLLLFIAVIFGIIAYVHYHRTHLKIR